MTDAMTKVVMDGDGVAHPKVHALIVAAGKGSRFGGELPKQYLMIGGQTVLAHSMDALAQVTLDSLNVVIAKDDTHAARVMETWCVTSDASASCTTQPNLSTQTFDQASGRIAGQVSATVPIQIPMYLSNKLRPQMIIGGAERFDSVRAGVAHIASFAQPDDLVLIHDAARPCVTKEALWRVLMHFVDCPQALGAILATPVADTLKHVTAGRIDHTVSRANLWQAQTPQAYRVRALVDMYARLGLSIDANQSALTDEATAFESLGLPIDAIASEATNVKLTHASDLPLITAILTMQGRLS